MEFITQFFQALKSPKTALVLFLFSGALLSIPIDRLGLNQPEFTDTYQTQILLVFFLASAILILEMAIWTVSTIRAPFRRRAREKVYQENIEKTFYSLNLDELCVLWAMTQGGTKTIKASEPPLVCRRAFCSNVKQPYQEFLSLHSMSPPLRLA